LTLIGSIRRECLDHIIIFGEAHLRRSLQAQRLLRRTPNASHWEDSPGHRPVQRLGQLATQPILGGLHRQYCRI